MIIMHTANKVEYEDEIKTGYYGRESLDQCGFVHCSDFDTYYLVTPMVEQLRALTMGSLLSV